MCASESREWNSAAYDRISAPQFSWGKKVLERLTLRGDELILDAGCGTGKLTGELLSQLPQGRVIGLDLSRNMVTKARENLASRFPRQIFFLAADLQNLPFNGVFDGIFSTAAFHWVPDHEWLFRNLYQALRPGAWLVAQAGGIRNLDRLLKRVAELSQDPKYARHLRHYHYPWVYPDPDTEARRLRNAGFEDIEAGLEPAPTRFAGAGDFTEFVRNVILHRLLQYLPEPEERAAFLMTLAEQAAADAPPYELDYVRLNLRARRPVAS